MRSPTCTSACWMCRGFFVSCKYSANCWSESLRPNQVFHQKRNGIRQISHATRKKRSFWVRDMPGFLVSDALVTGVGLADIRKTSPQSHRDTEKNKSKGELVYDIGV